MIDNYQKKTEKEHVEEIIKLSKLKKFDEVIKQSKFLLEIYPKNYVLYNLLAASLINNKNYKQAESYLKKAVKLDEKNIIVLSNLGHVSKLLKKYEIAENYYKKALLIKPDFLLPLRNLAHLKIEIKKYLEAINELEKKLIYHKKNYYVNYLLAKCYLHKGDFETSNYYFNQTLLLNPNYTKADYALSLQTKYEKNSSHLKNLKKKTKNNNLNEHQEMYLYYSLGKAYDDISEYDNSFENYKKGNDIKNKTLSYDISKEKNIFLNTKNKINLQLSKINFQEYSKKKIIFIVGMPRSGTTLAEQVLSSHKEVQTASELFFLTEAINNHVFNYNKDKKIFKFNEIDVKILNSIKNYYVNNVNKINKTENYIIDKDPLNFKWIGFIMKLFPNSLIVNCSRNPVAICWSNYKLLNNNDNLGYSYDLNNLAKFYNIYIDYMNLWFDLFSDKIYNLEYEKFTTNFNVELEKLLAFCNLEWDKKCLNFYKDKRFITTNPYAALQPIYKTSISSWKNYTSHLSDLINFLPRNK